MRWRGGEVFGSFPAKYRSSQRLPSLSAGVSFVCTSAGRGGKVFLPLEPKAGESHVIRCEEDVAEWGV